MKIDKFIRNEAGLTTIEWVVISAVVLVAALAISSSILGGANDLGGAVANQMSIAADEVDPPAE